PQRKQTAPRYVSCPVASSPPPSSRRKRSARVSRPAVASAVLSGAERCVHSNCADSAHYSQECEAEDSTKLRANFDFRSVRRDPPKLFDLFVGERDATGGPIIQSVKRSDPTAPISNSMNHDVESG